MKILIGYYKPLNNHIYTKLFPLSFLGSKNEATDRMIFIYVTYIYRAQITIYFLRLWLLYVYFCNEKYCLCEYSLKLVNELKPNLSINNGKLCVLNADKCLGGSKHSHGSLRNLKNHL
jgi:hypothetical protein